MKAAAVRCMLGEISYTLENRWVRHVPSSPVISGLYRDDLRMRRRRRKTREGGEDEGARKKSKG